MRETASVSLRTTYSSSASSYASALPTDDHQGDYEAFPDQTEEEEEEEENHSASRYTAASSGFDPATISATKNLPSKKPVVLGVVRPETPTSHLTP